MDPSQLQSDAGNDSHSLEGGNTIVEPAQSAGGVTPEPASLDTPISEPGQLESNGGVQPIPGGQAPEPKHRFSFKRLWQRINIYLLSFVLLMLICVGVVVALTLKNRSQNNTNNNTTTNSQNLDASSLKDLASTNQTVGTAKQTLTVQSNAIFNGTVLVRNDLEVAGTIKVSGSIALPGITVSGVSNFNQVQAATINTSGGTTVNGVLTAKNGLSVTGASNFNGTVSATQITTSTLQLNGNLAVTHHITAGGSIPGISGGVALGSGGTNSLNGSDTSGSITLNTGSGTSAGCFVTVNFAQKFNNTPHVVITPVGAAAANLNYYVNRSTSNFSICTTNPAAVGQTFGFDYMIFD